MKYITAIFFLSLILSCKSQLNLDSLRHRMESFIIIENDGDSVFTNYRSNDSLEFLKVVYDKNGNFVNDDYSVCIIYRKIDRKGRTLERKGFNSEGYYFLYDLSPIILTKYDDELQLTTIDYFNSNSELNDRETILNDSINKKIEKCYYDAKLKLLAKEVTEYNDITFEKTVSQYDSQGNLRNGICGCAVIYQKCESSDCELILERKYFDSDSMLVDCGHTISFLPFSILRQSKNSSTQKITTVLFDSLGSIVDEYDFKFD